MCEMMGSERKRKAKVNDEDAEMIRHDCAHTRGEEEKTTTAFRILDSESGERYKLNTWRT